MSQIVIVQLDEGETLSASLFGDSLNAPAIETQPATEDAYSATWYSSTFAYDGSGPHRVNYLDAAGNTIASFRLMLRGAGAINLADPGAAAGVYGVPLTVMTPGSPLRERSLEAYRDAGIEHQLIVLDDARQPVDLSGKTLVFTIDSYKDEQLGTGNVSIAGDDQNLLAFRPTKAMHAIPGTHRYSIREPANEDFVWVFGTYEVKAVARPPAA